MYAHIHCINTEKWGQYHNAEGTQGAHSTPKMTSSYSPRLYHMSLISKPICLLMSPYLDTRERKMSCQSTEPLEVKLQACRVPMTSASSRISRRAPGGNPAHPRQQRIAESTQRSCDEHPKHLVFFSHMAPGPKGVCFPCMLLLAQPDTPEHSIHRSSSLPTGK